MKQYPRAACKPITTNEKHTVLLYSGSKVATTKKPCLQTEKANMMKMMALGFLRFLQLSVSWIQTRTRNAGYQLTHSSEYWQYLMQQMTSRIEAVIQMPFFSFANRQKQHWSTNFSCIFSVPPTFKHKFTNPLINAQQNPTIRATVSKKIILLVQLSRQKTKHKKTTHKNNHHLTMNLFNHSHTSHTNVKALKSAQPTKACVNKKHNDMTRAKYHNCSIWQSPTVYQLKLHILQSNSTPKFIVLWPISPFQSVNYPCSSQNNKYIYIYIYNVYLCVQTAFKGIIHPLAEKSAPCTGSNPLKSVQVRCSSLPS